MQSSIIRRLQNNLQAESRPFDKLPSFSGAGIQDTYTNQSTANIPSKQPEPFFPSPLPAFAQEVPQTMAQPLPTMNDPQPQAPPAPPVQQTTSQVAPPKEQAIKEAPQKAPPPVPLGPTGFQTGPVKDWQLHQMSNTAGAFNNATSQVNNVSGNTGQGGYFSNVSGGYSGFNR